MKHFPLSDKCASILGLALLAAVTLWAVYLHLPTLSDGYLNAGDDHVHVAFANELARIRSEEGRVFGWSRLYGAGAPLFLMRPPGFYAAVATVHSLAGITVEEAEKVVVLLGFCLYPLSVFLGGRLLGLGVWPAVAAGCLAPLGISLWGHTLDAYQYLGVHKQLLAILIFPIAGGVLWRLLSENRYGLVFALAFPAVFLTHPYIAYCLALIAPLALLVQAGSAEAGLRRWPAALLWAIPTLLLAFLWLIPFFSSPEIQSMAPYLGRRNYFEVIGCTTAETLRQFFLGGLLDTTRWAGPFGGVDWTPGNEWGWRENGLHFRAPVVTALALLGLGVAVLRPRSGGERFLALAFLAGLVLIMGPDDFPFLDAIPFAGDFQNIHAIFLVEWAAFLLGGLGLSRAAAWLWQRPQGARLAGVFLLVVLAAWGSALRERTLAGGPIADLREMFTRNGRYEFRQDLVDPWKFFRPVVEALRQDSAEGAVTGFPQEHEDAVLYNLLPGMTGRPFYVCGFENIGGAYDILDGALRPGLRDSYSIQRLFDIRFVVNSPLYRKEPMAWHSATTELVANRYWELRRVEGDFGELDEARGRILAFAGSETEWKQLMEEWLGRWRDGLPVPWLVNLSNAGMDDAALARLQPALSGIVLGKAAHAPAALAGLPVTALAAFRLDGEREDEAARLLPLAVTRRETAAGGERFRVESAAPAPVLMKRAFYRGWRVTVDGAEAPIYRVAPGLQLVLLQAGSHDLVWTYSGPNRWGLARAAAAAGVVLALGLVFFERRRRGREVGAPGGSGRMKAILARLPTLLAVFFLAVFAWKAYAEVALRVPVVISPRPGERFAAGHVHFFWNHITGLAKGGQEFRVEVARDSAFADRVLFQELHAGEVRADQLPPRQTPYWFRIGFKEQTGVPHWSAPIPFFVAESEGGASKR